MTGGRMRRVDEAVREVLSGAITQELKDPRVGFITVTAVETSADLRHARVFVSVLGDEPQRQRSMAGLRSAHGFLQRRVADELTLKHTPTLDFLYDDSVDRSLRILLATHERPDGDALGSLAGMQLVLAALGKDAVAYMAADEFPLPYEYAFLHVENLVTEPPPDLDERTIVFLDCGNIDRNPADLLKRDGAHILNVDHHHDNTHFGTVNHVVPEASCTAEIIWDLMA